MLIVETIGGALLAMSAIMFTLLGAFSGPRERAGETGETPLGSTAAASSHDLAEVAKLMARKSEDRDIAA